MNDSGPSQTLVFVGLIVIVFLIFRELVCWYWKINQNIALLTEIRDLLASNSSRKAEGEQTPILQKSSSDAIPASSAQMGTCSNCVKVIPMSSKSCPKCSASFAEGGAWGITPL